jgi:hypothetical protein
MPIVAIPTLQLTDFCFKKLKLDVGRDPDFCLMQ